MPRIVDIVPEFETETISVRAMFFIDPTQMKKTFNLCYYQLNEGRNMDKILCVLEALQMSDKFKFAMPLDWKEVMK